MRKSDLLRGLGDRPDADGRPPEAPDSKSALRRLAWAVVGALAFFAYARLIGAA